MAINKTSNKGAMSKAAMRNAIQYVLQEKKIKDNLTYISGPYEYGNITWDNVYKSFNKEKELWNKKYHRTAQSGENPAVQSFSMGNSAHHFCYQFVIMNITAENVSS